MARSAGGQIGLSGRELVFAADGKRDQLQWLGANAAKLSGEGFTGAYSNYHVGAPSQWRSKVPHFATVRAEGIYPGVDAVYYWRDGQFEFDLELAPAASTKGIRMHSSATPKLLADGSVVAGEFRLKPAVAYQETSRGRVPVEARYRIVAGDITFEVGAYNAALPLVIDPVLFVGFFGGDQYGRANAITTTPEGIVFIAGGASSTDQTDILSTPKAQDYPKGRGDAFLAKLVPEPDGNVRLTNYTYWGGTFRDEARAVVVGPDGLVYFTGETESPDFPRFGAIVQENISGEFDAFLAVLKPDDPEGNNIWFSTSYGGANAETSTAIALDRDGFVYIGGSTNSPTIPGMEGTLQCCNRGLTEAWVAKFNINSGSPRLYATILGGTATDTVTGIAVDANRNIYLAGNTSSQDFPVTIEPQARRRNDSDVFVVRLDPSRPGLDALVDGFYVYGNSIDVATGLAISGNRLYLTGYTLSTDYPVTQSGYRNQKSSSTDAFVLVFDYTRPAPFPVTWGTYFGGSGTDVSYGITVAVNGQVGIAGYTTSGDFPLKDSQNNDALRPGLPGAFLAVFDPAQQSDNALRFSRVLSGTVQDIATGVTVDKFGRYTASGISRSNDLRVTNSSARVAPEGAEQSFLLHAVVP